MLCSGVEGLLGFDVAECLVWSAQHVWCACVALELLHHATWCCAAALQSVLYFVAQLLHLRFDCATFLWQPPGLSAHLFVWTSLPKVGSEAVPKKHWAALMGVFCWVACFASVLLSLVCGCHVSVHPHSIILCVLVAVPHHLSSPLWLHARK